MEVGDRHLVRVRVGLGLGLGQYDRHLVRVRSEIVTAYDLEVREVLIQLASRSLGLGLGLGKGWRCARC